MNQWNSDSEEHPKALTPSSEAITKPVTRIVVDETESFFSSFLPPGDAQPVKKSPVVSVAPTKSHSRLQEKAETDQKPTGKDEVDFPEVDLGETLHGEFVEVKLEEQTSVSRHPEPVPESQSLETEPQVEEAQTPSLTEGGTSGAAENTDHLEPKSPTKDPSKDIALDSKDPKAEDRQSNTPSPPVSAFSSGTSTTSDIEVLDHESVISESSASSRQETAEAKTSLHLMQGSFQLLSTSACADFPRLDDYSKLTESCGSSSDAFERIDSFSVHSLDSRSVSEVNSDDENAVNRTLASVIAGPSPILALPAPQAQTGTTDSLKDQSVDEMEESGRSATPVNSEQPDELQEEEQDSNSQLALSRSELDESQESMSHITDEQTGASTFQIVDLRKVRIV